MVRRQRRTGILDDRARLILRALVEEHIRTAAPVGSAAITGGYGLGVSPATVRGVLAELEELVRAKNLTFGMNVAKYLERKKD